MAVRRRATASQTNATHDDLVFAAYQGPVLGVGSSVLHQHRPFRCELLMPQAWRAARGLSTSQILCALLAGRACRPGATVLPCLQEAICPRCGQVLGMSGARVSADSAVGIEEYSAVVRTKCSSSWSHLNTRSLVLVVEIAPGFVVQSQAFAVIARESRAEVGASCGPVSTVPCSPTGTEESESSPALSGTIRRMLQAQFSPPQHVSPVFAVGMNMGIFVRVSKYKLSQESLLCISESITIGIRMRVGDGLLFKKSSIMPCGVAIAILGYRTPEDMVQGCTTATRIMMNEIKNPLDQNVLAEGLVEQIAVVTNW